MTLCVIKTVGAPVLREKAAPITVVTPEIRSLAADMIETLKAANGLGLAAPQVGESVRLIVLDRGYLAWDTLPEEERTQSTCRYEPDVLVNPEIVYHEGSYEMEEGCLSVPGYRAPVTRSARITYRWQTLDGEERERTAERLEAVAVQHEIDHLDGILFIDRLSRVKRNIAIGKVKKFIAGLDEEENETARRLYGKP